MDNFDHLSASEKAEATELQKMIAIEQQKAQFQAQVGFVSSDVYVPRWFAAVGDRTLDTEGFVLTNLVNLEQTVRD